MVLKTLLASSLLFASFGATTGSTASAIGTKDLGPRPVVVTPASSSINAGDSVLVDIEMDKAPVDSMTVAVSSNNPSLLYPATSTCVLAPNSKHVQVLCFSQSSMSARQLRALAATVRVTASANQQSAYSDINVN